MNNLTLSIFSNKIFFKIIKEIKLFSEYQINHHEDLDLCMSEAEKENQLVIFFSQIPQKIKIGIFPLIVITDSHKSLIKPQHLLSEELKMPFKIIDFKKIIVSLIAKSEFKKNSLINLNGYIIDKNERKLKKNNLEIQLSEMEVNFLILFSKNKEPISKNVVLKNVWKYSEDSETHTVETHIHRLRKKILVQYGDNNFIKNNNDGYYI